MSGGTGVSSLGSVMPANTSSSLLQSAHPIALPHSLGGNTHIYESHGGYYPGKDKKSIHHKKKSPLSPKKKSPQSHKKQKGGKKRHSKSRKNRTRKNFS